MSVTVLTTDDGPHPPEKWACVSLDQLMAVVSIAPSAPPDAFRSKRALEDTLLSTLVALHAGVQKLERELLAADNAHLHTPLDPATRVDEAVKLLVADTVDSPLFSFHFSRVDVQEHMANVLTQHFLDVMHIERHWHAHRLKDSGDPHVAAYRAKHNMG